MAMFDVDINLSTDAEIDFEYVIVEKIDGVYIVVKRPILSFGKRTSENRRRTNECLVLENSEMIVIDYPNVHIEESSCRKSTIDKRFRDDTEIGLTRYRIHSSDGLIDHVKPEYFSVAKPSDECRLLQAKPIGKRNSHASDSSSAYSGSDVLHSSISGEGVDMCGVNENIDSDDEDGYAESLDTSIVRDNIQDIFDKDKDDRTEFDIETLFENFTNLPAFANLTTATRREMCRVMALAEVKKADTIVLEDGEILDSWSILLNGQVEVQDLDGSKRKLNVGDSFGITPTKNIQKHVGVMRTLTDNCQFICIDQENYYRILTQGEQNTVRHKENNRVVLITEQQIVEGSRRDVIIISGTKEKLLDSLLEISTSDPTYVEDFLLTYRTFLDSPLELTAKLLESFQIENLRERVTRIILLWLNNHYTDFEHEKGLMEFLEEFERLLTKNHMKSELKLLNIACAAKAKARNIVLHRSDKNELLSFHILGGQDRPIFITNVQKDSKAQEAGLKRGDEILQVNNQNFDKISHKRALELLRASTHLALTVKSNLMAFNDMIQSSGNNISMDSLTIDGIEGKFGTRHARLSAPDLRVHCVKTNVKQSLSDDKARKEEIGSSNKAKKIRKLLLKLYNSGTKSLLSDKKEINGSLLKRSFSSSNNLKISSSNPDLTEFDESDCRAFPDYVIRVYRSDQTFRYLPIQRETTVKQVIMLTCKQFSIMEPSLNFTLSQISVEGEDVIKQKRLPDQMYNLAEQSSLNGRYYLKHINDSEPLMNFDELKVELLKEGYINLLQLNPLEIAAQLTLKDFSIFHKIQPSEYIDDIYEIKSPFGTENVTDFVKLVNEETLWVVSEILKEPQQIRRVKLVKLFIKIGQHCFELKNFNSVFALVSGLDHVLISKLYSVWEKIGRKNMHYLEELRQLFSPMRNFANYRRLINREDIEPPIIPFFPLFKKDLSYIHLSNSNMVDDLINFEKLRMLAREIRHITSMAGAHSPIHVPYLQYYGGSGGGCEKQSVFSNSSAAGIASAAFATVRRKRKQSSTPNLKKIYDECLMVRKVRDYLEKLQVIEDDDVLKELAMQCDSKEGSVRNFRREPSPSLQANRTTRSSASSLAPNAFEGLLPGHAIHRKRSWTFGDNLRHGVDNLDSINKLINLRTKLKLHNNKHDPIPNFTPPSSPKALMPSSTFTESHSPKVNLSKESSSVVSAAKTGKFLSPVLSPRRNRDSLEDKIAVIGKESLNTDRPCPPSYQQAIQNKKHLIYSGRSSSQDFPTKTLQVPNSRPRASSTTPLPPPQPPSISKKSSPSWFNLIGKRKSSPTRQ